MHQLALKTEIVPLETKSLAALQTEIIKHYQKQTMLMVLYGSNKFLVS